MILKLLSGCKVLGHSCRHHAMTIYQHVSMYHVDPWCLDKPEGISGYKVYDKCVYDSGSTRGSSGTQEPQQFPNISPARHSFSCAARRRLSRWSF